MPFLFYLKKKMPHGGNSLSEVYGEKSCPTHASLGACSALGHCSQGGSGHFDWGYGYSSRALRSHGPACDPTSRARDFYSPCSASSGSYLDQSGACAGRTLESWDDATVPDTINYVDTHFYQAGPSQRWNETFDLRGDVPLDVGKCLPVVGLSSRRGPRILSGDPAQVQH